MKIFEWLENRSRFIFQGLCPDYSYSETQKVVDFVRILFSLIMLARFLHAWDSESLFHSYFPYWLYIVGYLLLLAGLFTPATLLFLFVIEAQTPLYIAVGICMLIITSLFFLGAGQFWSFDCLLSKISPRFKHNFGFQIRDSEQFKKSRFYLVLPYGLLCLIAAKLHIQDPLWRNLTVNHLVLTSPLITQLHMDIRSLFQTNTYFAIAAQIGVLSQLFWELFFIPLLFSYRGTIFIIVYGLLFFFISKFVINLSSLGTLEFLFWLLVFHPELNSFFRFIKRRLTA